MKILTNKKEEQLKDLGIELYEAFVNQMIGLTDIGDDNDFTSVFHDFFNELLGEAKSFEMYHAVSNYLNELKNGRIKTHD